MSLRGRVERLEDRSGGPGRCEACGGRIVFVERLPSGRLDYPFGPPCPECRGKPSDGSIGFIEVVLAEASGAEAR